MEGPSEILSFEGLRQELPDPYFHPRKLDRNWWSPAVAGGWIYDLSILRSFLLGNWLEFLLSRFKGEDTILTIHKKMQLKYNCLMYRILGQNISI